MDKGIRKRHAHPGRGSQSNPNGRQQNLKSFTKEKNSKSIPASMWCFIIAAFYFSTFKVAYYSLNNLPTPKDLKHANPTEFKEILAKKHLAKFVGFGPRNAGSLANEVHSVKYILEQVSKFKESINPEYAEISVDVQHPTGSFSLTFLSGFASYYTNITNTVVKLSPVGGKSHATLLLNCHTDSVIGGLGASDDAVACAVLLETMRALVADQSKPLLHSVIFLFNGAEENILQASHGFITQHPWAKEIKAFINLEAAGAGGKEIVFQTGPENPWLLQAWASHAPHPFGSIVGQELFQSGIIPSDTDFRIFRDHGKIPGIDLAYFRNGYVYHTYYDNMEMMHPGCIQRAGDNILAVVKHLVKSPESLLDKQKTYMHGKAAFVDVLGLYMMFVPIRLLSIVNIICCVAAFAYIIQRIMFSGTSGTSRDAGVYGKQLIQAAGVLILSLVSSIVSSACVAGLLTALGRPMSFYSQPLLVAFLYLPAVTIGSLLVHSAARRWMFANNCSPWEAESVFFDASLFLWSLILFQLNRLQVQTSFILLLVIGPIVLFRCYVFRMHFSLNSASSSINRMMSILAIAIFPTVIVSSHCWLLMELFIPLCGRLGSMLPPDLAIGVLTSMCVTLVAIPSNSLVYLARSLKWILIGLFACLVCSLLYAISDHGFPYSGNPSNPTPKRLFLQHTSREFYGLDGTLAKSDSGIWSNSLDYGGMHTKMGAARLDNSPALSCEGLFCRWPFGVPIEKLVRNPKYAPAKVPSTPAMKDEPLTFQLLKQSEELVSKNSTVRVSRRLYKLAISGPSQMSLTIGPLSSEHRDVRLSDWSIKGDLSDARASPFQLDSGIDNTQYSGWYFVYYGSGMKIRSVWDPWFQLTITEKLPLQRKSPVVEVGVTAQYPPQGTVVPLTPETDELQEIVGQLHDWVSPMHWVSLYRNYLF